MLQFTEPVKFLKSETKKGISSKTGKPYEMTEVVLFVTDLGRVKVPVVGSPRFPADGQMVNLILSVDQGGFNSLRPVYDEACVFSVVKA